MIVYRDARILEESFPFEITEYLLEKTDNCEESYHWHNFCEVTYVQKGQGKYFVNGRQYELKEGDLIIFNNTEPHGWLVESETMSLLVMVFSMDMIASLESDYLRPFIERGSNFRNKISKEEIAVNEIYEMMKETLLEYVGKKEGSKLLIIADLLRILTFLIRYYQKDEKTISKVENLAEKKKAMKRFEKALAYINSHYTQKITLNEVATVVKMSENYFSAYFKKVAGCSFIDYVTELRLKKATELMNTTELNMNEIAIQAGFHNMSNFYRMYKKHRGELPKRVGVKVKKRGKIGDKP